ncbi:MAG TPA: MerR family transcriptional regulator [Geminicoccus sp.]|uniref:MerR family transcriptional regulator n=1 Tax=Geminicoccus sp. TaxID=2024832 RepID=UPI002E2FDC7B|nr:MerR family transcriptional regulator [Geminicoccus sp.]HEX2525542.1 MerR family transcriptional regulator [Geminicoccus sp.]
MSNSLVGPGGTIDRSLSRPAKAATAFRTISEVADELDVAQHVLRFWESKFPQVRPLKRGGGRRYYRPEDIDLLRRIRGLLYDEGYTIKGVQKLLRVRRRPGVEEGEPSLPGIAPEPVGSTASPDDLPEDDLDEQPESRAIEEAPDPRAAAYRRALAELHAELLALADLAGRLRRTSNPALSEPTDGAIDRSARSVAQPG